MIELAAFLTAFTVALVLMPINIAVSKKLKAGQPILSYVDNHISKSGTPTMGGIAFILASFTAFIFARGSLRLMSIAIAVMAGYGLIGFMDDILKVRFKNNKGLSALQKIIFQLIIASIVATVAYYSPDAGSGVFAPFTLKTVELGLFALPFYIFIFLAFTNSVNLTDGLDGLAASVTIIFNVFLCAFIMLAVGLNAYADNSSHKNLAILLCSLAGGLVAFLIFNAPRASVFMGDTGSMALGGCVAAVTVFSQMSLNVLTIGIMYIVTSISVIIQVAYFKFTGKRVFLMSPLHHHFERKGMAESKIVCVYAIITLCMGIISLLLFYILGYSL